MTVYEECIMSSGQQDQEFEPNHDFHVPKATWTHIALHAKDIEKMIAWYEEYTHLTLLYKEQDENGYGAWLGDKTKSENPFILVLMQFFEGHDPFAPVKHPSLGPFAHIGIELPGKQQVDDIGIKAKEAGCLILGPVRMPKRIGYICFVRDPEGNTVEFSYDQGVYTKAREVWGRMEEESSNS
jgi:catechol 2,3-dioxygenase-like lactoylglutathione lyase family enzyme